MEMHVGTNRTTRQIMNEWNKGGGGEGGARVDVPDVEKLKFLKFWKPSVLVFG